MFSHHKGEEGKEEGRGQQFFFDQRTLDSADRKRRQQEGMARRGGKRDRQGVV